MTAPTATANENSRGTRPAHGTARLAANTRAVTRRTASSNTREGVSQPDLRRRHPSRRRRQSSDRSAISSECIGAPAGRRRPVCTQLEHRPFNAPSLPAVAESAKQRPKSAAAAAAGALPREHPGGSTTQQSARQQRQRPVASASRRFYTQPPRAGQAVNSLIRRTAAGARWNPAPRGSETRPQQLLSRGPPETYRLHSRQPPAGHGFSRDGVTRHRAPPRPEPRTSGVVRAATQPPGFTVSASRPWQSVMPGRRRRYDDD